MEKQKNGNKSKRGLGVKKRAGRRTFNYQIPPEVADQLPEGATVTMVSLSPEDIYELAQRVEPEVTRWLVEKPAKNPLEALLLMVEAIYALLQPPEMPIPSRERVVLARVLAQGYDFAPAWPYTRAQLEAAMIPGHADLRPEINDEHILFVAGEVAKRRFVQMAEEGVTLRDAAQAAMLVVTLIHQILFDQSSVFGADQHEMYHIARVLVESHTFHPDWPYRDQVKAALTKLHAFKAKA